MALLKGTKIFCPKCDKQFSELVKDICAGERIMADHFKHTETFMPKAGDKFKTPCCNANFFLNGKVYTEEGFRC